MPAIKWIHEIRHEFYIPEVVQATAKKSSFFSKLGDAIVIAVAIWLFLRELNYR